MSWDIVIFNTTKEIEDFGNFNSDDHEGIDFNKIFKVHFENIKQNGDHYEIIGKDFSIDYFGDSEPSTNCMVSLYGENGLYELTYLAKKFGWQIFDTRSGEKLDLDDSSNNGYKNFQKYLKYVLKDKT